MEGQLPLRTCIMWQKNQASSPLFAPNFFQPQLFSQRSSTNILGIFFREILNFPFLAICQDFLEYLLTPRVVSPTSNSPGSIWFISIPLHTSWSDWIIPIEFPHFVNSCSSMRLGFDILSGILQKYSLIGDWGRVYSATCCILWGIISCSPLSYSFSYKDPAQTILKNMQSLGYFIFTHLFTSQKHSLIILQFQVYS